MTTDNLPSLRAQVITRRTYNRPLIEGGFESWEQTVDRVIGHQSWLWNRADTAATGVWTIKVGDSVEAWAKSLGKLVAHAFPARELILDFTEIRPAVKAITWKV